MLELINIAMIAINANTKPGNPILTAWMSADKNHAFLEFRTPEEAINAYRLDGLSLLERVNIL